jgi:hypothetical protein
MITCTGFNYNDFHSLLCIFAPILKTTVLTGMAAGHHQKINAEICLGLVLIWTRTQGSLYVLQPIFGYIAGLWAFYRVLWSRGIESMITCTGFDYNDFHSLLHNFAPIFKISVLTGMAAGSYDTIVWVIIRRSTQKSA